MATLTAPGVYVEEVSGGVRPIEAAGTSTAAFFGEAERGPIGRVTKVFSFGDFQAAYGGFLDGGRYLAHSVYAFFLNGGAACYVGRVAPGADTASVTVKDRGATAQVALTFQASSPGTWGNGIMVLVDSTRATDPRNQFNLTVLRDTPDRPVLERYADLVMDPGAPNYAVNVVGSRSQYLEIQPNTATTNQANGYSESAEIIVNGTALLGTGQRQLRVNLNGDGWRNIDLTAALGTGDLTSAAVIRGAIETTVRALTPLRESTPAHTYDQAAVTFTTTTGSNGVLRITAGGARSVTSSVQVQDAADPTKNAAGALKLGPRNGGAEVTGAAPLRPQDNTADDFYFLGDDTVSGAVTAVTPGTPGGTPQDADYNAALRWLDTIRDASLLAVPGIGSRGVVGEAMAYCANRPLSDLFFIGDTDAATDSYSEAVTFRDALTTPNSYGAVYFPWVRTVDPSGRTTAPLLVPPSGFVAGLYGRIDGRRGVWKAPAGTEATISGAVGLAVELTDGQHGDLNGHAKSLCVIRRMPAAGIVAWGARTVSSDPEYRYVPVRRMAIFLRVSIYNGIQWAVFEPNDEPLWASLRLNINAFMNTQFRRGAFQGATPGQAYFVKCDAETNPQAEIDQGIVNVLVGFAPLKPAEFVVVRIRQQAGQQS